MFVTVSSFPYLKQSAPAKQAFFEYYYNEAQGIYKIFDMVKNCSKFYHLQSNDAVTFSWFLLFVFAMLYLMIYFTVTLICNQIFQNKWGSDSKKYKTSPTDKQITSYPIQMFNLVLNPACFFNISKYPVERNQRYYS